MPIFRCCARGCKMNSYKNPERQFFQFPKKGNFYNVWLIIIHRFDLLNSIPDKNMKVCDLHFLEINFCQGSMKRRLCLRPGAVPSKLVIKTYANLIKKNKNSFTSTYLNIGKNEDQETTLPIEISSKLFEGIEEININGKVYIPKQDLMQQSQSSAGQVGALSNTYFKTIYGMHLSSSLESPILIKVNSLKSKEMDNFVNETLIDVILYVPIDEDYHRDCKIINISMDMVVYKEEEECDIIKVEDMDISNSELEQNDYNYELEDVDMTFTEIFPFYKDENDPLELTSQSDEKLVTEFQIKDATVESSKEKVATSRSANGRIWSEDNFLCEVCSFTTKTEAKFVKHEMTHSIEKPFACDKCSFKTTKKSYLTSHCKKLHVEGRSFNCDICSYTGRTHLQLRKHNSIHTGEKVYACNECSFTTNYPWTLKSHTKSHSCKSDLLCEVCSFRTKKFSIMKNHMLKHTIERSYSCDSCAYKTIYKYKLKTHMLIHTQEKPELCYICPFRTNSRSVLRAHMRTHSDVRPYACNFCSYKAKDKSMLARHTVRHSAETPFACTACSYRSKFNTQLKIHMKIHSTEKPFVCHVCAYSSRRKSNLDTHMMRHTGEKRYSCHLCSYKSINYSTMKAHNKIHHSNREQYACEICSYRTIKKSQLTKHAKTHFTLKQ